MMMMMGIRGDYDKVDVGRYRGIDDSPTASVPAELTPAFKAMSGRDKWETLVLSGLIGTNEPWIAAMTETLRAEADMLENAWKNPAPDAAPSMVTTGEHCTASIAAGSPTASVPAELIERLRIQVQQLRDGYGASAHELEAIADALAAERLTAQPSVEQSAYDNLKLGTGVAMQALAERTKLQPSGELIERVARALCVSDGFDWEALLEGDRKNYSSHEKVYLRRAQAALAAMSEGVEKS